MKRRCTHHFLIDCRLERENCKKRESGELSYLGLKFHSGFHLACLQSKREREQVTVGQTTTLYNYPIISHVFACTLHSHKYK